MTDAWSITDGYWDVDGEWHATAPETREALKAAMGAGTQPAPPDPEPMWFLRQGETQPLWNACDLVLEDGALLHAIWDLPPDLPLGYHELRPLDEGPPTWLVVSPDRCPQPARAWGWAVQLYAARSERSWGIGDLGDLRDLSATTARLGAGVAMISPLHAPPPTPHHDPSPYYAASRIYRNPLHLRIEDVPGADDLPDLGRLVAAGRALNDEPTIDRPAAYRLKLTALRQLFDRFVASGADADAFESWRQREGAPLTRHATYCALAEKFGPVHQRWPAEYRHPRSAAVPTFARYHEPVVRFHEWCQWQLFSQLAAAGAAGLGLISDVAVGFDDSGSDAWAYQDLLAPGCRVGAPPDEFNSLGQDWGLPPFVPWKLRQARYEPIIRTLRAAFAHSAGMRIDHVMGLFRLYWLPPGRGPTEGAYVRYAAEEMLDLVALEAHRADAYVVGEDLGTVEDEVREQLDARGILSYRLVWFEDEPTDEFPSEALAAVTTHDLPTIAGVWTGTDKAELEALGLDSSGDAHFRRRLLQTAEASPDDPLDEVVVATHRRLALAPSILRLATLEDALGVERRPNVPGTVGDRPNWRLPLPKPVGALEHDPLLRKVAAAMDAGDRRIDADAGDRRMDAAVSVEGPGGTEPTGQ